MATTTTGTVQSTKRGKPFTYTKGPLAGKQAVTTNITLDTDTGQLVVQRNGYL